jgi:hypothetical protein
MAGRITFENSLIGQKKPATSSAYGVLATIATGCFHDTDLPFRPTGLKVECRPRRKFWD